jgi:hypothetical protein
MSGAECILSNKENVSDKVLHCSTSGYSVEENKALVQNSSEKKPLENFPVQKLRRWNKKSV